MLNLQGKRFGMKGHKGLSLIEVAFVLLILSLAMVPVLSRGVVGKGNTDQHSSTNSATRDLVRAHMAANTLVEMAMAGDAESGAVSLNPALTQTTTRQVYGDYKQAKYYQWKLAGESVSAAGNKLTAATLQIFDNATDTTPKFELSTHLASLAQSYPAFVPPPATATTADTSTTGTCRSNYTCTVAGSCTLTSVSPLGCSMGCSSTEATLVYFGPPNCDPNKINTGGSVSALTGAYSVIANPISTTSTSTTTTTSKTTTTSDAMLTAINTEVARLKYEAARYNLVLP